MDQFEMRGVPEWADLLGVSTHSLYDAIRAGELKAVRLGEGLRGVRVRSVSMLDWLEKKEAVGAGKQTTAKDRKES